LKSLEIDWRHRSRINFPDFRSLGHKRPAKEMKIQKRPELDARKTKICLTPPNSGDVIREAQQQTLKLWIAFI